MMSMLADHSETIQEALNVTLKIHYEAYIGDTSVRKFLVPTLNYEASHYSDITADLLTSTGLDQRSSIIKALSKNVA